MFAACEDAGMTFRQGEAKVLHLLRNLEDVSMTRARGKTWAEAGLSVHGSPSAIDDTDSLVWTRVDAMLRKLDVGQGLLPDSSPDSSR